MTTFARTCGNSDPGLPGRCTSCHGFFQIALVFTTELPYGVTSVADVV